MSCGDVIVKDDKVFLQLGEKPGADEAPFIRIEKSPTPYPEFGDCHHEDSIYVIRNRVSCLPPGYDYIVHLAPAIFAKVVVNSGIVPAYTLSGSIMSAIQKCAIKNKVLNYGIKDYFNLI